MPFLFFVLVLGIIHLFFNKEQLHFYINQFHHPFYDKLFLFLTVLGGGVAFGVLLIYLFFKDRIKALIFAIGYAITGLTVQILKRYIFEDIQRPMGHFRFHVRELYEVPGAAHKTKYSFPSGHTADIFFVMCAFVLLQNLKNSTQRAFFYIALLVGFSRVYLSQHFLIDIYIGSIIGVLFSLITVFISKGKIKDL